MSAKKNTAPGCAGGSVQDPLAPECGDYLPISRRDAKRLIRDVLTPVVQDIYRYIQAVEQVITYQGEQIMNVQEYAAAVDAETNRIADALEDLKNQLAADGANDQAELDAAFGPVLERLRGVGVSGETAPPPAEEPAPVDEAPVEEGPVDEAPVEEAPADPAPSSDGDALADDEL